MGLKRTVYLEEEENRWVSDEPWIWKYRRLYREKSRKIMGLKRTVYLEEEEK